MNSHLLEELSTSGLNTLGQHIFLDRYSLKLDRQLTVEDLSEGGMGLVVVIHAADNKGPSVVDRTTGFVKQVNGVLTEIETVENGMISVGRIDVPIESHCDMWHRVAKAAGKFEKEEVSKEFFDLLKDWKFLPGGRILASLGSKTSQTGVNCFVLPHFEDTRAGIMKRLHEMVDLMAQGGGVGINISALRPRGWKTVKANGRSSGSVSWAEMFSHGTGLTSQGGSRRGALMIQLAVWHPDIIEFINAKRDSQRLTFANISVAITDDFMAAVKEGRDWTLRFPDTTHEKYREEWDGDLKQWESKGYPVIPYKTLPAVELWDMICSSAWASAEPGLWFSDRSEIMSNSTGKGHGLMVATNPCGEQVLPGYGVCNLGHINLSRFVNEFGIVDWEGLEFSVRTAVRFLDNVIDLTNYPLEETEIQQLYERRIGLGTMGLAEMLIRLELRYGDPDAEDFIERLYKRMALWAYEASIALAIEKGPCKQLLDSPGNVGFARFMENIFPHLNKDRRNITLLTQAPTGTVGTMVGTSTGIEPLFALEWERRGRVGNHKERAAVYQEFLNTRPYEDLPSYFVTAMQLTPYEHVQVQSVIQKWVDSSISKTVNCPAEWTVDEVKDLYMELYDSGCKGGTIYRDRSRSEQVLNLKNEEELVKYCSESHQCSTCPNPDFCAGLRQGLASVTCPEATLEVKQLPNFLPRPSIRRGTTVTKKTPVGNAHITVTEQEGEPIEVFLEIGKGGSDLKAMAEALGRISSLMLRLNSPVSGWDRVASIADQLQDIGGRNSIGMGPNRILSLPDAVGVTLQELWEMEKTSRLPFNNRKLEEASATLKGFDLGDQGFDLGDPEGPLTYRGADLCPQCGMGALRRVEGCKKCTCGYSEC